MSMYNSSRRLCIECASLCSLSITCKVVNYPDALSTVLLKMPKCKIANKVEKRFLHFQAYPLHQQYKPRLSEISLPAKMWSIFYRQNQAFDFAKDKDHAKIFSVELPNDSKCGPRSYIVSSLEEFWSYYIQLQTGKRHFYEVIPSDANCHMYFDLEFDKTINPCLDGQKLVNIWIEFVSFCLEHELNISSSRNHVIELDSTTDTKFSQHLIWHIPNAVFKSNLDVGNFVHNICDGLRSYLNLESNALQKHWIHSVNCADELKTLYVQGSSGEKTLFVDEGVYTKNRNFRLYLSSKKGKATELKLSPYCTFDFCPIDLSSSCCVFHCSGSEKNAKLCFDKEKLLFFSSLVSNVHSHSVFKILEFAPNEVFEKKAASVIHTSSKRSTSVDLSRKLLSCDISADCFTMLLEFVTNYVQKFNENAYVSKITYERDSKILFYDISGTRYCRTIGREHKSNGIFIVINLEKKLCYHRCYDHDCRRSDTKPLPVYLPTSIAESLNREAFLVDDVTDSELLQAVEEWEST